MGGGNAVCPLKIERQLFSLLRQVGDFWPGSSGVLSPCGCLYHDA